jgi:hypothetical protein
MAGTGAMIQKFFAAFFQKSRPSFLVCPACGHPAAAGSSASLAVALLVA